MPYRIKIAGVLARQHRRTGTGLTFTKARVAEVRRNHRIPPFRKTAAPACHDGHVVSITQAAAELGVGISTIYRWLADGFRITEAFHLPFRPLPFAANLYHFVVAERRSHGPLRQK